MAQILLKPTITLAGPLTAVGASAPVNVYGIRKIFQIVGQTTSGAGSVTASIQGSLDGVNFVDTVAGAALTLGTAQASQKVYTEEPWNYWRVNVTAISGTGASITVYEGHDEV